jgi:hypothetical protein
MHLLAQGWKRQPDGTPIVAAIALSPCTNGMEGWQMHVGCYNPACGETIQQAVWKFQLASGSLMAVLNPYAISEIATWGDQQAEEIKDTLQRVEVLLREIRDKICQI